MQPLLNLKSFLAALLVLAVPGALLVAYFRDYSPDAGGHEHAGDGMSTGHDTGGKSGQMSGDMPVKSHGNMPSGQKAEMPASMGHDSMASATPGQPGMVESGPAAILHIGAKGFFLDRPQTFTPRADQAKILRDIKDRSTMDLMAADKKLQQAEERLWKLTSSDRPDITEIETRIREAEKLRSDQRIEFIRAVSEAANLLTPEQKDSLLRSAAPAKPKSSSLPKPSGQAEGKAEPAHKH